MSIQGTTIVVIDDTSSIRTFLRVSLEDEGAMLHEAATGGAGISLCEAKQPDVVVLDLGLPDMDGMEVLPKIKALDKSPIVIILSVRKNRHAFADAKKHGADGYLTKPFMVEDLIELIEEKLES